MALISVIVPLYNKAFIIKKTLQSVLDQIYTDFEVLIVNDGSTDTSYEIVKKFDDSRIKILNQENKGAATARNTGVKNAKGKLIAFLDADDTWLPNHLETLVNLYYDFPNCGIYCNRYSILDSSNVEKKPHFININENYRGVIPNYFKSNKPFRIAITLNTLIPKTIIEEENFFSENVSNGQDLELWTKIALKHNIAINNVTTCIYNYYISNSLSKTKISEMKLLDFSQFEKNEKVNPDLKSFLDLYRLEYGLHFKIIGEKEKAAFYLNNVDSTNKTYKIKLLLVTPSFILRSLLKIKHWLRSKGFDFSIYS